MAMFNKALVTLLILVVPLSAFLYLKSAENAKKVTMQRYGPREAVEVIKNGEVRIDTQYHKIPAFSFTTQHGTPVTNEAMSGKIYVANFFFTNCLGMCLKMSHQFSRLQEAFLNEPDVLLLSHTVDPERDTVETLAAYAQQYGAIREKWFLVTGDKPALYEQARKGYFVSATEGDGGPGEFVHTEKFILVDKSSNIRGYYDGTNKEEVDELIRDIKFLLWEEELLKDARY